jgi:uncharacterized protein YsxB (DUF464 family)
VLEITFYRDDRDRFTGVSASGHAEFAEYGNDVVCAAVSAILQAARLGLMQVADAGVEARQAPGNLELAWPESDADRESVRAIVATAELAVGEIARQHPEHVRLHRVRRTSTMGG